MVVTASIAKTSTIPAADTIYANSINSTPVAVLGMAANGGSHFSNSVSAQALTTPNLATTMEAEIGSGLGNVLANIDHHQQHLHHHHYHQDESKTIIPNLSTLSLDELKQLDTDPEFFDDFIEEMSVVQQLNEELDSMINQVEIIARENESKEVHLVELKRKLSDDVTTLKNLGEKCDQLNKKYLRKSEEYEPQHIRELLQIAASDADVDCERHVELFLNGKIDVQTFLQSYTHSKKISSERKVKEERLTQQLEALERAGL